MTVGGKFGLDLTSSECHDPLNQPTPVLRLATRTLSHYLRAANMRIKKVLLSGFKSYREQGDFPDFHPRMNVLREHLFVPSRQAPRFGFGKNGSGKSNLIFAIRFLLGQEFVHLRPEERKALLHKGKDQIVSGYVEIHFDNSDKRFPVDADVVRLRRSIGLTKSDYSLNNRTISADDVMNLLESAGFSRSNPYYIVQQGKVQALSQMKASERLELLREVAGTRVYDDRRKESLKIMEETKGRLANIEDVLGVLDERLDELEQEKGELAEYQKLDRNRRILEFTIYNSELEEVVTKLEELDAEHLTDFDEMGKLQAHSHQVYLEIKEAEEALEGAEREIQNLNARKEALRVDREAELEAVAKLELEIQSASQLRNDSVSSLQTLNADLKKLEKEIAATEKRLQNVAPSFAESLEKEAEVNEKILNGERLVQELHSKRGRSAQFRTVKERDVWIKKETKDIDTALSKESQQIKAFEEEISDLQLRIDAANQLVRERDTVFDAHRKRRDDLMQQVATIKDKRDQFSNKRKEIWRKESEISAELQNLREVRSKHERQLNSTMSREQADGLDAIKRYQSETRHANVMRGVYGPLIELFSSTEEEMVAVEATAKSHLFSVVVDTDDTAAKVMQMLEKDKAGRVTFIPLNKLEASEPTYPRTQTSVPLIERLTFNSAYRKAFIQVFGRTILCASLEEASSIAKTSNIDCITIDGDRISRKGAFSGGFNDERNSRLASMKAIRESADQIADLEGQLATLQTDLTKTENLITKYVGQLQEIEKERVQERATFEKFSHDSAGAKNTLLSLQSQKQAKEYALSKARVSHHQLEQTKQSLQAELGTKQLSRLSSAEEGKLHTLTSDLTELKEQLLTLSQSRARLQSEKEALETKLINNLLPRQAQLKESLNSLEFPDEDAGMIDALKHQLAAHQASLEANASELNEVTSNMDTVVAEIAKLKTQSDQLRETDNAAADKIDDESKLMERLRTNRSLLLEKKADCEKKLREISLPGDDMDKYAGKPIPGLSKMLHATKKKLKKFAHVNKKALDQFEHFSSQKITLRERKEELDESEKAIETLIKGLDDQKEAALQRTFKMVARFFAEVFSELTDHGRAELLMLKRSDERGTSADSLYEGIEVKVSFTKSGKLQRMHQLSGGQQSLVALSLIFAIQRCDPAPFYVFDEIDSALDDTHRLAVAEMIGRQSSDEGEEEEEVGANRMQSPSTQFICITHRPEMVAKADSHYMIEFKNKVSRVLSCNAEQALGVLGDDDDA